MNSKSLGFLILDQQDTLLKLIEMKNITTTFNQVFFPIIVIDKRVVDLSK